MAEHRFERAEITLAEVKDESWQINAIRKAVDKADRPEAKFTTHEDVSAWLETWGAEK